MPELVVFVSSIMNPAKDDLLADREVVKTAIESLQLTRPWRFEDSPASSQKVDFAYLNQVSLADIFIMILGKELTAPVRREYEVALEAEKPRLIFLKKSERTPELQAFVKGIDVKWKAYADTAELKKEVISALSEELINGYRGHKIELAPQDVDKLQGQKAAPMAAPAEISGVTTTNQSGGVNLGAGAQVSGPVAGGSQRIVEIRRAGRDYYEARDQAQINITYNSSIEEVLKLFDTMSSAVDELDMPAHAKRQVKHAIDGAKLETEADPPNKEAVADRLKEAATIVKNTTNLAVEATNFGMLLVKGLVWVGKTIGWLAL